MLRQIEKASVSASRLRKSTRTGQTLQMVHTLAEAWTDGPLPTIRSSAIMEPQGWPPEGRDFAATIQ